MGFWITKITTDAYDMKKSSGCIANNNTAYFLEQIGFNVIEYGLKELSCLSEEEIKDYISQLLSPVSEGDIIFIQFPSWEKRNFDQKLIKKANELNNVKVVILLWDVVSWLFDFNAQSAHHCFEFSMIKNCDLILSPNKKMSQRLREYAGVTNKIVDVSLWDYRCPPIYSRKSFANEVTFVGSFSKINFSDYVGDTIINLIGNKGDLTEDEMTKKNLNPMGAFNSDDIPPLLNKGFLLMSYQDNSNTKTSKHYLGSSKYGYYNNPLKLSLYLACGLPIIIDKSCTHAKLIKRAKIGIVIEELNEIPDALSKITPEMYNQMLDRMKILSKRVRNGFFIKRACLKAINILSDGK